MDKQSKKKSNFRRDEGNQSKRFRRFQKIQDRDKALFELVLSTTIKQLGRLKQRKPKTSIQLTTAKGFSNTISNDNFHTTNVHKQAEGHTKWSSNKLAPESEAINNSLRIKTDIKSEFDRSPDSLSYTKQTATFTLNAPSTFKLSSTLSKS